MARSPGDAVVEDGRLPENILRFARTLRAAGIRVGSSAVIDAIRAVETIGIGRREDFYWVLHATLISRREDQEIFDQAFRLFWRKRALLERMMRELVPTVNVPRDERDDPSRRVAEAFARHDDGAQPEPPGFEVDASLTMSAREVLHRKDFEEMTAAEIAAARALIARLVLPMDKVATRRLKGRHRGPLIDMRRTFRASLRSGGELIDLKRLDRLQRHPPIVAICDISGSMTSYSRMFLHFLHALGETRRVHSFVFGTRLTNVSRQIRARDPDEALRRCSEEVADWAGGTRIASCLRAFNRRWSRRVLGQGAIVLLVTDGLERDADADLAFEADRLRRSCRRLVWLNPLLRYDAFEAKAQGIRTMLPHVDDFRAIHNVEAMSDLVAVLDARRPAGFVPATGSSGRQRGSRKAGAAGTS